MTLWLLIAGVLAWSVLCFIVGYSFYERRWRKMWIGDITRDIDRVYGPWPKPQK